MSRKKERKFKIGDEVWYTALTDLRIGGTIAGVVEIKDVALDEGTPWYVIEWLEDYRKAIVMEKDLEMAYEGLGYNPVP